MLSMTDFDEEKKEGFILIESFGGNELKLSSLSSSELEFHCTSYELSKIFEKLVSSL